MVLAIILILPTTTIWSLESQQDSISRNRTDYLKIKAIINFVFQIMYMFYAIKETRKKKEKKKIQTGSSYEKDLN